MSVQCVKLITGEELIGEIPDNRNDSILKIKDPVGIHLIPNQSGQVNLALLPWLPYAEDHTFVISKDNIVVMPFTPSVDLLNRYNQMFGSGIQIASQIPS